MRFFQLAVVALAALSAACSGSKAPPADPPPPQKTVIDAQLQALQKAKAVQDTVDQQKKDADKKLEEAGG